MIRKPRSRQPKAPSMRDIMVDAVEGGRGAEPNRAPVPQSTITAMKRIGNLRKRVDGLLASNQLLKKKAQNNIDRSNNRALEKAVKLIAEEWPLDETEEEALRNELSDLLRKVRHPEYGTS